MLRYFPSSPPGRFATTLDDLLPGRFAPWTFFATWTFHTFGHFNTMFRYIPGRFATATNFQTGGKTSSEIAKHPGVEMSKGAKCPGGKTTQIQIKFI